jgi:hypothetical protein
MPKTDAIIARSGFATSLSKSRITGLVRGYRGRDRLDLSSEMHPACQIMSIPTANLTIVKRHGLEEFARH